MMWSEDDVKWGWCRVKMMWREDDWKWKEGSTYPTYKARGAPFPAEHSSTPFTSHAIPLNVSLFFGTFFGTLLGTFLGTFFRIFNAGERYRDGEKLNGSLLSFLLFTNSSFDSWFSRKLSFIPFFNIFDGIFTPTPGLFSPEKKEVEYRKCIRN